ncbi:uncharacterized protein LOC144472337 [Augochlora pura]
MRIGNLSTTTPHVRRLIGKPISEKIKYYWDFAWNEAPELMFTSTFGIFGFGSLVYYISIKDEAAPPKNFREITIYRPDDPRVEHIRKDHTVKMQGLI